MKDAATSLDRLHDIVEPPPVSFWPPAPGWYLVIALGTVAAVWFGLRRWRLWQANAYRREALRELEAAGTSAEIAELLRRTALVIAPRSTVASLSGDDWVQWLSNAAPEEMPQPVQHQLAGGIYAASSRDSQTDLMRAYARTWIARHRPPVVSRR